jgi:L-asparaginase / beta-aspartyl-peptidase
MKPALIVHGGAWWIDPAEHEPHLKGVEVAARAAWEMLQAGHSALDAVEKAVTLMEDDPTFDAATGSVLNCVGEIELDAMLMDGQTLSMGAVAALKGVRNPIQVARLVMQENDLNLIVGSGAHEYARMKGVHFVSQAELTIAREIKRFHDLQEQPPTTTAESFMAGKPGGTVGAVAMDLEGNIAAATSTGGTPFKLPGRVGDSPLVGSGTYADNLTGGASATGHGEKIMRLVLAKYATDLIEHGREASQAAKEAIQHMENRVQGYGGLILIDKNGNPGFAHNTPHMAAAWYDETGTLHTYIQPPA